MCEKGVCVCVCERKSEREKIGTREGRWKKTRMRDRERLGRVRERDRMGN